MENKKQLNIGNNLKIFTLEDCLKQTISESGLPIGTIYYVLNSITNNIKELYEQQVNAEYNEYKKIKNEIEESSKENNEVVKPEDIEVIDE